jgi:hypothetical protein
MMDRSDRAFLGFACPFDLAIVAADTPSGELDMSFSLVRICNMALGKCGVTKQIDSLEFSEEETVPEEARLCSLYFELAFRAAARGHDWKCLSSQADISGNLTTAPVFGYDYAYSLPSNCIRVLRVEDEDIYPWRVQGRTLVTDATSVKIDYIQYTMNTDLYDDLFTEALVMRLAAHLAPALSGGEEGQRIADNLMAWHEKITLPEARFADSAEGGSEEIEDTTWRDSRL